MLQSPAERPPGSRAGSDGKRKVHMQHFSKVAFPYPDGLLDSESFSHMSSQSIEVQLEEMFQTLQAKQDELSQKQIRIFSQLVAVEEKFSSQLAAVGEKFSSVEEKLSYLSKLILGKIAK